MKKITLVLSVLLFCAVMNAQQQVATLVHEGNVRVFYGADAFVQAHGAAVSGDAISLSAGIYNSCDITKNIAIRGAGWRDASNGTHFSSDVHIKIQISDTVSNLSIEGVKFRSTLAVDSTLRNPTIMKCYIYRMTINKSFNGAVISSIIRTVSAGSPHISFVNSIVYVPSMSNCSYSNCVLSFSDLNRLTNSTFESCIVFCNTSPNYNKGYVFLSSNVVINCVGFGTTELFINLPQSNVRLGLPSELFITAPTQLYNGYIVESDLEKYTFELSDSAKTTYVDANGSQVGIYGGAFPFTDKLNYPTIKRMQVAKKPTADGKLSVDIEVTTEDEE